MIVDSDVLIWYLRGNHKARAILKNLPLSKRGVSSFSLLELYSGARNRSELMEIQSFFVNHFSEIYFITEKISSFAVELILRYSLSGSLRPGDAMIAATALVQGVPLLTANRKHFRFIRGLQIRTFKP